MDERTPFSAGDPCLLFDDKERQYLLTLRPEGEFQYHLGMLPHSAIIGTLPGTVLHSTKGSELIPMRPRLADYVLKMKRGATPVYPKDAGSILVWADVGPGMTVLEAGTGSGGLTMVLARAVGASGRVVSVERREDHAAVAERRISAFFGGMPSQVEVRIGDVVDHVADAHADRIVLDLPEPWHVVPGAAEHLPGGGILAGYLPTVPQVQALRQAIADSGSFIDVVTFELLLREWAVDGRSVRPEHRMVGHTGFITVARRRL
jgi:tRNA (adenine57-N1/adenine58-N1)-methyltransferase